MKLKTSDILTAISALYPAPEWAMITEFQPEPGYSHSTRRADVIVIHVWPSGKFGQAILGFEIKTSRADFLNDLKDPTKFPSTYKHCDRAYYACPKGMIKREEVPPGAGLLWVDDKGAIELFEDRFVKSIEPVSRRFFASIARRSDSRQQKLEMADLRKQQAIAISQLNSKVESRIANIQAVKNLLTRILV